VIAMHIDAYRHGRMVINGHMETKDVIITGGEVHGNWWRHEGHRLSPADLDVVWKNRPRRLIVGTGSTGMMQPTAALLTEASRAGVELEVMTTSEAVARFNELSQTGDESLAAAFHLTC